MRHDTHLGDAALLGRVDGIAPDQEAEHLERCEACRSRLAALTRASERLGALLELAEPVEPAPEYDASFLGKLASGTPGLAPRGPTRHRGWILLLAAGLAALLISVSPAGAWLTRHLAPLFGGRGAPAVSTGAVPADASSGGSEVSAYVSEGVFVLNLSGEALPGQVRIGTSASGAEPGLVSARLTPGGADGSVLVEPGAFRIRAAAADTLTVTVPPTVRRVRVFVDERLVAEPDAAQLRERGVRLELPGGS